jgi:hypothetical protein
MFKSKGSQMTLDDADAQKIAQAIGMLVKAALGEVVGPEAVEVALQAGGWALAKLGEAQEGEDLIAVCEKLCDRHNRECMS